MQKYIAVVNPRMDDDEIGHLIAKDIAGALFEISHQNYPLAAKIIRQVKELSQLHNRPVSILQDISSMEDPMDLEFGMQTGADWFVTDKEDHLKMARGLNKLAHVIYKGRNLPKGIRVDSVMADSFLDPDAEVLGQKFGQIKHMISEHPNQKVLDSLINFAHNSDSSSIAVSDIDLAKNLSWRRPHQKIIFAPKNHAHASKAAIYWGVHPIYAGKDLVTSMKSRKLTHPGQRVVDATNVKHVAIHLVP